LAYLLTTTKCFAIIPDNDINRSETINFISKISEFDITMQNEKLSENHPYNLNLNIRCLKGHNNQKVGDFKSTLSEKTFTIKTDSEYGCALSI